MRITLDTTQKTVEILEDINFKDLYKFLSENIRNWEMYTVKLHVKTETVIERREPYRFPKIGDAPNPLHPQVWYAGTDPKYLTDHEPETIVQKKTGTGVEYGINRDGVVKIGS